MAVTELSERAREFVDELLRYDNLAVSDTVTNGVNHPGPNMMNEIMERVSEWEVQWWNEDDEDTPWEIVLILKDGLGVEDGLLIANFMASVIRRQIDWDFGSQNSFNGDRMGIRILGGEDE